MNWLAYLALLFTIVFPFLHRPWLLVFAIVAASCGLLSALIRYWSFIEKITSSFLAKVVIAIVAASALVISPWLANTLISEVTLLRPSAFPAAYTAVQAIAVLLIWAVLVYCGIFIATTYHFLRSLRGPSAEDRRKLAGTREFFAWLGRVGGLAVLLVFLAPRFIRAANYDSGGTYARLITATSFVPNIGQEVIYASGFSEPSDCRRLAIESKLDLSRGYTCRARTIRCSNLSPDAKIAYLTDKDVVVATDVARDTPLFELSPVRFDVTTCDQTARYQYYVKQVPQQP